MKSASELGVEPLNRLNAEECRFISRFTASELSEAMRRIGAEGVSDFFAKLRFHQITQKDLHLCCALPDQCLD